MYDVSLYTRRLNNLCGVNIVACGPFLFIRGVVIDIFSVIDYSDMYVRHHEL